VKQFVKRLLQERQLIGQDLLSGVRLSIGGGLLLTGLAVISLGLALLANPDFQSFAKRMVAASLPGLAQFGTAQAADMAVTVTDETALRSARERQLPPALLVGIPAVGFDELSKPQQAAALFLARKYGLAPDAIAGLVCEAYRTGKQFQLDPLLLLAVMSIESSMNPFAQSPGGAQGLMQVMTTVHAERFEEFGGPNAALNPIANIRVGAQILRDLHQRFGTTPRALKAYVGATDHPDDAGYGLRVLTERARLESAVTGLPFTPPVMQQTAMTDSKKLPTEKSSAIDAPLPIVLPPSAATENSSQEPNKDGSV
jgi:hypothetical protein